MLNAILKQGLPLRESIEVDDPWGLGIRLRIYRKDATDYDEAVDNHPKNQAYRAEIRSAATARIASTRGARRGKGGKVKPLVEADENAAPAPTLYVEDLADQIAEHLIEILQLGDEAREAFRIQGSGGNPAARLDLLCNAPVDGEGRELCFPAAFRGEDRQPIWDIADVKDGDEEVPWGGIGLDNPRPTLNNMMGLWIVRTSEDPDAFGITETAAGASTVRPTSSGNGPSSADSESSIGEP